MADMHRPIALIGDLDAEIANSDLPLDRKNTHRAALGQFKRALHADLTAPKPSETTQDAGATITHRPDLVVQDADRERIRQAQQQGDADKGGYPPLHKAPLDAVR